MRIEMVQRAAQLAEALGDRVLGRVERLVERSREAGQVLGVLEPAAPRPRASSSSSSRSRAASISSAWKRRRSARCSAAARRRSSSWSSRRHSSRRACADRTASASAVLSGVRIEDGALLIRPQQGLVLVLAVQVHQPAPQLA